MSDTSKIRDLVVLMGPAGAGKSTLGAALAARTAWPFLEGDDFHPPENKDKQASGRPLTDADRAKWIDAIVGAVSLDPSPRLLLACSALTPYVQARLVSEAQRVVRWFLLLPSRDELQMRLEQRTDHFMPAGLLGEQLAALSPPTDAICLGAAPVDVLCAEVMSRLA